MEVRRRLHELLDPVGKSADIRAFEGLHPAFAALYFVAVLALTMTLVHPVTLGLAAIAGIAYNMRLRGVSASLRTLVWQIPLLFLITLLNPLFSMTGSTELLRIFDHAIYFESLAYGACMGLLLVATFQWFSNAAAVITSDKIMLLLGSVAPTVGLLITMTMRLVPQFVRRGSTIADARNACTAAGAGKTELAERVSQVTVLMGWGMEDSLETSDSMRARGWGATRRRSSYVREEFRAFDGAACACLAALVVLCAVCHILIGGQFSFYPVMGSWATPVLYAPFVVLLVLPWIMEVVSV